MQAIVRTYSLSNSTASSPSSSLESTGRYSSVIDAVASSSQSTAPTSLSGSPRLPDSQTMPSNSAPASALQAYRQKPSYELCYKAPRGEDLSPSTLCYPRASVDTFVSGSESEEDLSQQPPESALDSTDEDEDDSDDVSRHHQRLSNKSDDSIPPLPEYRHDIVDRHVYPSTPNEFARLFPSLDRMSVRHDEFTTDGNMNLRVDIAVPEGSRRLLTSYQLFHLRMYDLTKREFSLRRYSRDSGREVCNSKLHFIDPSDKKHKAGRISRKSSEDSDSNLKHWDCSSGSSSGSPAKVNMADFRPALQRSMTTALRSLGAMASKPAFRRSHTVGSASSSSSSGRRPATSHSPYSTGGHHDSHSYATSPRSRSSWSSSTPSFFGREKKRAAHFPPAPKPTNTIKLEFSNYARVDLQLRGGHGSNGHDNTRYEYEWWGHKYTWKRSIEKHLNVASYHLLRDDNGDQPIAHIVPEMRSPNQVDADEQAGGWIPPCHMWIADSSVLTAETDVAE